jgi:hypothetical protein
MSEIEYIHSMEIELNEQAMLLQEIRDILDTPNEIAEGKVDKIRKLLY